MSIMLVAFGLSLGAAPITSQNAQTTFSVRAAGGSTAPIRSIWTLKLDNDGTVAVSFSGDFGTLSGQFDYGGAFVKEVQRVIRAERFFELPPRMYDPATMDAPCLKVEVTLEDRIHMVSLCSPLELKDKEETQRFLRVWNMLFTPIPGRPSY
jgi:hypothetical protein